MIENNPAGGKPWVALQYGWKGLMGYGGGSPAQSLGIAGVNQSGVFPANVPDYDYMTAHSGSLRVITIFARVGPTGNHMRFWLYKNGVNMLPVAVKILNGTQSVSAYYAAGAITFAALDRLRATARAQAGYNTDMQDVGFVAWLEIDV